MSSTILARLATARRIRLHDEAARTYDAIRARYRAAYGTPEEGRLLRLLARAYDGELRRALPIFS